MANEGAQNRTEAATGKRRGQARSQGHVALSPEVSPAIVLITAVVLASAGAPALYARARMVMHDWLVNMGPMAVHDDAMAPLLTKSILSLAIVLAPFMVICVAIAITSVTWQVGWAWNPQLLVPDLGRLNFAKGVSRIFNPQTGVQLVKAVLKVLIVATVSYRVLKSTSAAAVQLPGVSPAEILTFAATALRKLFLVMWAPLAVLAAADFLWTRWRFEESLKMSKQEVKDEHKDAEGDVTVKSRMRRVGREMVKRRMLTAVRTADVVLTNPTHVAVALRYRAGENTAPQIIAKGAEELAARIKDEARKAGVPIVERRALARALFRTVKIGQEIPPTLYRAVAEILAYVYSLRGQRLGEAR